MDNIVISFQADTSGLKEVDTQMENLKDREQDLLVQINKLNLEYQAQAKEIKKTATSQSDLSKQLNTAYADRLSKEREYREALAETRDSLSDLAKQHKELDTTIVGGALNTSMTKKLRAIKDEMRQMEESGDSSSQAFINLREEAGRLEDQIGDTNAQIRALASDTKYLDATLNVGQGLTGTFAIAQSGMALLGGESEELQKAFFKVQAAQQLLNSVTQVASVLNKDSVANVIIKNMLQRQTVAGEVAEAGATTASTGAIGIKTIAVKISTVAMKIWNATMLANPALVLVAGIMAIVGAIAWFVSSQESAAEAQIRVNELEKIQLEQNERATQKIKDVGKVKVDQLNREMSLLQAKGASEQEIAKKRQEILQAELATASEVAGKHKKEIDNLEANRQKAEELKKALDDIAEAKANGNRKTEIKIDGKVSKVKVKDEDVQKQLQGQLDNINAEIKVGVDASEGLKNTTSASENHREEEAKKARAQAVSTAVAEAQIRVIQAQKGSAEELSARLMAIQAEKRAALENVNLTAAERRKITIEADKKIEEERKAFAVKRLENEKAGIEAEILLVQKGSAEEVALKEKALEQQLRIELSNTNLSAGQRKLLEIKYLQDVDKLYSDYNQKQSADKLNIEIATINGKLATVKNGTDAEYELKKDLLRKQAELSVKTVADSAESEELKAAKIFEINQKLQGDIEAMKESKAQKDIDIATKTANQEIELERVKLDQIIASANTTWDQKAIAQAQLKKLTLDGIDVEKKALEDKYTAGLISEADYQLAKTDLTIQGEQARLVAIEEAAKAEKDIKQALMDAGVQMYDMFYNAKKDALTKEAEDLDRFYTTDAEEAKKNSSLKLISEEEMEKKKLEIKRKQAKLDKEKAMFDAFVAGLVAVSQAYPNIPLSIIVGAMAAANLAVIAAKPLPKYWKGRKAGAGEMAWVGENGPEIMWIPNNASIVPAHLSRSLTPEVMKEFNMPMLPMNIPEFSFREIVPPASISTNYVQQPINYDKLGKAVAENVKIPEQKEVSITIDKEGISQYLNGSGSTSKNLTRDLKL